MLCHLGNVSYKLGRDVRFDPKTEKFGELLRGSQQVVAQRVSRGFPNKDHFPIRTAESVGGYS
jgi:hypothetical protein